MARQHHPHPEADRPAALPGWLGLMSALLAPLPALAQSSPLDGLFGLDRLSFAAEDATLGWEHPLPAWGWALVVLAALGVAGWSYSRLLGPRPARLLLAGLRAAVLIAIVVLIAGPTLIDPDEREEPDALVVLVDRSGSMTVEDAAGPDGQPLSRDEALRQALLAQADVFGEEGLDAGARQTVWLGFGEGVRELSPLTRPDAWYHDAALAGAPATRLRTALDQALRTAPGRPLASVVLFSDGRSPQSTGAELVRQAAQRGARIHVVPLGAPTPPFDLAVESVDAPEQAFAGDALPVTASVVRSGDGAGEAGATVRLVDAETESVVDEQPLPPAGEPARLTAQAGEPGTRRYRVEVVADAGVRELVRANNREEIEVEIVDRPIRVLYIEGYPRWEYRYLKNMLVREESIDSSILLLSADRAFAQEGDSPITRPPVNVDEMRPYDVIILGDVPPGYFTPQQLELIRDQVASRGAGLLWIGGTRFTPGAYGATALADLLPMRQPGSVASLGTGDELAMRPTPAARALSVLELRGPGGQPLPTEAWAEELPALRWAQALGELKPTAEVLAAAGGTGDGSGGGAMDAAPLLARLRYGAGQSLYAATDETWRWRYGRGELYFEQFWVQLVRMLGRQRLQQQVDRARLDVSHRRVTVDEPVVVELTIDDPALLSRQLPMIDVAVAPAGDAGQVPATDRLQLRPVPAQEPGGPRTYRAVWRPGGAGAVVLRVTEPALDALGLARPLEVLAPDDELRQVAPDHARLAAIAGATGGEVVPLNELSRLVAAVPNLAEKTAIDAREPLWNSWLALLVVLGLLTAEWIVRKALWLA